jgi:hypothetical protein
MRKKGRGVTDMLFENEFLLKMDLQKFADGEDEVDDEVEDDDLSGEEDLFAAIKNLQESEEDEEEDESDEEDDDDDSEEDEDEEEDDDEEYEEDEDEEDEDEEEEEPTTKKKQSKEDNAKFAEKRRQSEVQKRVQAELDRLKVESPEFKLAKSLSDRFGKPVEQIMAEMEEAALVEESKNTKIPLEILRNQKAANDRADQLEQQLNDLKFQSWQSQINTDRAKLEKQYPVLDSDDMDLAVDYILNTVKNVDLPLEQAVFAVHGKKIIDGLANAKVQNKLANESGRKKKTALPVGNGKQKSTKQLSADEAYMAKQFGMTDEEYNKFKS